MAETWKQLQQNAHDTRELALNEKKMGKKSILGGDDHSREADQNEGLAISNEAERRRELQQSAHSTGKLAPDEKGGGGELHPWEK